MKVDYFSISGFIVFPASTIRPEAQRFCISGISIYCRSHIPPIRSIAPSSDRSPQCTEEYTNAFPPASGPRSLQAILPAIQFPGRPKHRYVKSGPYPKGFVPAPIYNVHSNLSESARHIPSGARTKHLLQKPNAYFYNLHQEPTTAPATKTASIYPYLNDQIHPGTILPGYNNVSLHAFLSRGQPKPAKLRKHNAR